MSEKVVIQLETLTRLADGFRESRGIANNLTTEQMITLAQEPIKPEQEKTIDITENGITEIPADEGYTLSKVTANVNVATSGENKLPQLINRSITEITAEDLEGMTIIGNNALSYCKELLSVEFPETITNLDSHAFEHCTKLTRITLPNSLINPTGERIFYYCENLEEVNLGSGIQRIPYGMFNYCEKLTNLTIPANVTRIDSYALQTGSSTNKGTYTFLSTTPPTITSTTFYYGYLNKIIVPAGSGETYKAATNWANLADYIEETAV